MLTPATRERSTARSRCARRPWWTTWRHGDQGSASAEITLLTPVLVMLLVVIGIVIHRGVETRLRIDAAAHQAARAASLEHTPAAATTAARATVARALSASTTTCRHHEITTSTGSLRPGSSVTVTVTCDVDLADALLPGLPTTRRVSATAREPVDRWRSTPAASQP
jgi:Flp pilus assembly protein TadG